MQLDFWTQFKEYATSHNSSHRLRKAYPQHGYDISVGNSKSHLALIVDSDSEQVRCEFYIPDSKPLFAALLDKRETVERKLGYELEWMELEGKKASRVRTTHRVDVVSSENWEAAFQWLMDTAQQFQNVVGEQLKRLKF